MLNNVPRNRFRLRVRTGYWLRIYLMLVAWLLMLPELVGAQTVFINEIHYDNSGTDVGEGIEIAGPAGTDLTGWRIVRYNGSNGAAYTSPAAVEILNAVIPDLCNGFGVVTLIYPASGLQNGPDGIALVDSSDNVIQFISYEGEFTATNGPANGLTSADIGVSEASNSDPGHSLQLSGNGREAIDFTWSQSALSSMGQCNPNQVFVAVSFPPDSIPEPDSTDVPGIPTDSLLFLADELIFMKKIEAIHGHVQSNRDIRIRKGRGGTIRGDLLAVDDIRIGRRNQIHGNVRAGDHVSNRGQVSGAIVENAILEHRSIPSVPAINFANDEIVVGRNEHLALAPGSFGLVEARRGASLSLSHDGSSGLYELKDLVLKRKADLFIDVSAGPVEIRVAEKLRFGQSVRINVEPGGESNSDQVSFIYGENDRVAIGRHSHIIGTLIAPEACVDLGRGSTFRGAITAKEILVRSGVVAIHHKITDILTKVPARRADLPDRALPAVPMDYTLDQNYPNPFNPSTTIGFTLAKPDQVTLVIYNVLGQMVKTLLNRDPRGAGRYVVNWDGRDFRGARAPSGVYIYQLRTDGFSATKRLVVAK